ncbi:MAG: rod-binding protein [Burkholderiales bacterium]|nr:rod-binding protein [Burkholderiales bacterium]
MLRIGPGDAQATLAIDPQRLGALEKGARTDSPESIRKVAKEFESLLLAQLMKSMRTASFGDPIFDSESTRTFTGMLDEQTVQSIATKSPHGMGLADAIVRQIEYAQGIGVKKPLAPTVNRT